MLHRRIWTTPMSQILRPLLPVTSRNTLDCADSSHAVHMTSRTGIVSLRFPAILAPFPVHGIYLRDPLPISVHIPVSVSFRILSLYDLSVYDSVSVCPHVSPHPSVSASIPDPFIQPLSFPPCIYKSRMSCMSPQFIYRLQLDYCHSLSARDLSLPPRSLPPPETA